MNNRGGRGGNKRQNNKSKENNENDTEWKREFDLFLEQLRVIGLTIKDVAGDGNCLFRAISDQIEGNSNNHAKWRKDICKYIEDHRLDFEPFIEDDETFEGYIAQMKRNATWGGQMEIQALSLAFTVNVTIHQLGQPRWDIINFPPEVVNTVHLSYHDGQHYSSIRKIGDFINSGAPPKQITIESKAAPRQKPNEEKIYISDSERMVMDLSGCKNLEFIRQLLKDNYDNVDETLEFILTVQPDEQFQFDYVQDKTNNFLYDTPIKTTSITTTTTTTTATTATTTNTTTTTTTTSQQESKNERKKNQLESVVDPAQKLSKFQNNNLSNKQRKELNKLKKIDNNCPPPPPPKPRPQQEPEVDNTNTTATVLDLGSMTI